MRTTTVAFFVLTALTASAQTTGQVSATGFITDTLCGRKGATPNHIECAKRSVASGKAKYALYDERTRKLYILEPAAVAEQYLGQRVRISGSVTATPIRTAGESYAPDAVATATTGGAVSATSGAPLPSATPRVQQHPKALDTTTPVAGTEKKCLTKLPAYSYIVMNYVARSY